MNSGSVMKEDEEQELDEIFEREEFALSDFIKVWRQQFLKKMKPMHLPLGWTVDHLTLRTFGKNSVFYKEEDHKMVKNEGNKAQVKLTAQNLGENEQANGQDNGQKT